MRRGRPPWRAWYTSWPAAKSHPIAPGEFFGYYVIAKQYYDHYWDILLREEANRVHPVGLYDLNRLPRKVGKEYRQLIEEWRDFLPTGSSALMLL